MKKINLEELRYFIYSVGKDSASKQLCISSRKQESVLFGKYARKVKFEDYETPGIPVKIEVDSTKLVELYRVVSENYEVLKKLYRGTKSARKLNQFGFNFEDSFHSGLLKMFELSSDFVYSTDIETVGFIKKFLFYSSKAETLKIQRNPIKFEKISDGVYSTE